ncbi:MAG: NADH-quinone oxidoreductase subunit M, partial [Acaryochloridaceae cyanobacterium CSU_5_19]|nr:NADH-quinone oxidoreductase subunit M [Acaryochloridaceae cyanobacterium CSU_5_19]
IALLPQAIAAHRVRLLSLFLSGATLLWMLWLVSQFNLSTPSFQFRESLPWLPYLGLSYELGVDGLSLPLLLLNTLLTWIAIYSSRVDTERPRLFYSLILLISGGVAGAFLAQNLLLFFLFYEIELIPFYLLISVWGGTQQGSAATKFLLYTATSGGLILAGFLGVIWFSDTTSFTYETLLNQTLPLNIQYLLLVLLLLGFGIKTPLVPLHTWLPDTYVTASTPVSILLGGVLAKLGTYGIFRFCMQLFPDAWVKLSPWLATWAVFSVLYGALAAIAQKDIKRMVAYSSVGHMGYILLAAAAQTELSIIGAIAQMFAHGLILALLFHLVGIVETKVGTRDLEVLNGLMNPVRGLPLISALLVLGGMASAGIPGLVGFIAEFLVFQGSYIAFPIQTLISVVGTGLTAVYFVILLNRTCFGKLDNNLAYYSKVNWNERIPALVLVALIVVLGLHPTWLVRWSEPTTAALMAETYEAVSLPKTLAMERSIPSSDLVSNLALFHHSR